MILFSGSDSLSTWNLADFETWVTSLLYTKTSPRATPRRRRSRPGSTEHTFRKSVRLGSGPLDEGGGANLSRPPG